MIYYIIFSYLFLIGIRIESKGFPTWNIVLAPITFPVLLGQWFAHKFKY